MITATATISITADTPAEFEQAVAQVEAMPGVSDMAKNLLTRTITFTVIQRTELPG